MVYPHVQWARMGKVVKLDAAAKERGKGGPAAKQRKTGRRRRSKTALVLGGGGFTGGVYEIGALRALDLLSVNRTVNQFDVYVGTSAGSMIAAMTANGITPEEMMRVVNRQVPTPFRDVDIGTLLRPNLLESELYLVATDLDTCERIIFGAEDWDDVPISSAVAASTALPMVYKPVEIKDRELVDGGIVSTTNIDIAVEAGAKFLVVVNPLCLLYTSPSPRDS